MSKKLVSLFLALLIVFSMTASLAEGSGITVTDMYGREVTLTEPATRIVVMQPSDCEILCAIGCEDAIVGRGQYVDYPASILEVPVVQSGENTNIEEILALNLRSEILYTGLVKGMEAGECEKGIAICGSGEGINMTLNKHQSIRAALCWIPEIAHLARQHNDANVLVMPGRFITNEEADAIMDEYFQTPFEGGRHERRIAKIPVE